MISPSKALFYCCISFVVGIALQSFIKIPQIFLWGFLLLGIFCIIVSFFKKKTLIAGFCLLFLVLGIMRLQVSEFSILNDKLSSLNDLGDKVTLTGQIISEPNVKDTSQTLRVKIADTQSIVLVTLDRYPEYKYLDEIKITGKLKSPAELAATPKAGEPRPGEKTGREGFNYKNYLAKEGIYSVMGFPTTELISNGHGHNFFTYPYEKILQFKEKLKTSIQFNFSPPQSFILEGILLGNDSNMPQETREKLNATGLSHLTAISGSNVIILSGIMMIFLLGLGFWRGQAFYVSLIFIWLYIVITGFPASGVRAVIMASVFLLAQNLGRQNTSSRVIVMAGAIMLLQNPLLLLHDAGFQLSFMASMGIIYLKPVIDNFFRTIAQKFYDIKESRLPGKIFLDIVSITLAAQIFTLPLLAYHFNNISLVSLATNLLVIPIVDFVMIFGFLAAFLGMLSNVLGFIFSIPVWLLLSYFIKVMEIFYQPWSVAALENVSWLWMPIYYMALACVLRYLEKAQKPKFLGF